MLALSAFEHLIVARIGVGGKMSYVRNIHNSRYVVARVTKIFLEYILHNICAEISDMRVMINRRAAGVHIDLALGMGDKLGFFLS